MKRILFLLLSAILLFPAASFAQEEEVIKVKKEKTTRMGLYVSGAPVSYKISGVSGSTSGTRFEFGFAWSLPFKPSDIECPWLFNMKIGIMDINTGKVSLDRKFSSDEEDLLMLGLFPMSFGVDYVCNPLSSRGKFKIYGLGRFSFLDIGVPYIERGKSYNYLSSDFGIGIGAEIGIKYGWQHFEIALGGFAGVNSTYSDEKSGSMSNMGVAATLFYYF